MPAHPLSSFCRFGPFWTKPFFRFLVAMGATRPATGPALALLKLANQALDMLFSGLFPFDDCNPANPLVPGERCDVLPGGERLGIGAQGCSQIIRQIMDDARRDGFLGHVILS